MSYGGFPYNKGMDLTRLGYVAGIVDGEGCIRRGKRFAVAVKMTDLDVLERCRDVTGIGRVYGPYVPPLGRKPQWTWAVSGRDAAALLMTIYPLLCERRQERIRDELTKWRQKPYRMARYTGPSDDKRCGTNAGHQRHSRMGTPHCRPCMDAHNAYSRARRAK